MISSPAIASFGKPIIKSGVRILRPDEYGALRAGAQKEAKRVALDALLYSGLRYVEAKRLKDNPSWLDPRGFIHLPESASHKHKRRQKERWVRLNAKGLSAVGEYLTPMVKGLPTPQAWGMDLRRWAMRSLLDPQGLGPKTTRKTWESWLMSMYPQRWMEITLNQGHTGTTSLNHYLNMPFLPEDKARMQAFVEGMF